MGKCEHCDGLGGIVGRWTCEVCGGSGYAPNAPAPKPDDAVARALVETWQSKWPAEGVVQMTYSPKESLIRAIAAALTAERMRALEDALRAVEAEFATRVNSSGGATWETNGLADALAIVRALKAKP